MPTKVPMKSVVRTKYHEKLSQAISFPLSVYPRISFLSDTLIAFQEPTSGIPSLRDEAKWAGPVGRHDGGDRRSLTLNPRPQLGLQCSLEMLAGKQEREHLCLGNQEHFKGTTPCGRSGPGHLPKPSIDANGREVPVAGEFRTWVLAARLRTSSDLLESFGPSRAPACAQ